MPQRPAWVVVGGGAVVHLGLLRTDAQAEQNEQHGESRVKTGAATSEELQRCMSPFSQRGPSGRGGGSQWWEGATHSAKIRRL